MTLLMYLNAYCVMKGLSIGWRYGGIITNASGVAAPNIETHLNNKRSLNPVTNYCSIIYYVTLHIGFYFINWME